MIHSGMLSWYLNIHNWVLNLGDIKKCAFFLFFYLIVGHFLTKILISLLYGSAVLIDVIRKLQKQCFPILYDSPCSSIST